MELLKLFTMIVCDYYGIPYEYIFIRSRRIELVQIRQMASAITRELEGTHFKEIGLFFGKDHATIVVGVSKVKNYLLTDKKYKSEYTDLLEKCRSAKSMNYFYNIENDFSDIVTK